MSKNKLKKNLIIQSILFNKKLYNLDQSISILNELRLNIKNMPYITKNIIWFEIIDKKKFAPNSLQTFKHPYIKGVELIMGKFDLKHIKGKKIRRGKQLKKRLNPSETIYEYDLEDIKNKKKNLKIEKERRLKEKQFQKRLNPSETIYKS